MRNGIGAAEEIAVTIAIAITRPQRFGALLLSLHGEVHSGDQILAFLEGVDNDVPSRVMASGGEQIDVTCIHHPTARGLSKCRNLALDLAFHPYLIYLDDDVVVERGLVSGYRRQFSNNYQVVGGPLLLPKEYQDWPTWLPRTYGSLVGIQMGEQKIWGGNFGIDRRFAMRFGLRFDLGLGRHEANLCSGEDTQFIQKMRDHQARVLFDPTIIAYHHICVSRFTLQYLFRRAYWQGRTEVLRDSTWPGFCKEARRAMGHFSPMSPRSLVRLLTGSLLLCSVIVGILHQKVVCSLASIGRPAASKAEGFNSTLGEP